MRRRRKSDSDIPAFLVVIFFIFFIIITAHFSHFFASGGSPLIYTCYLLLVAAIIRNPMIGMMLVVILIPIKIKFIPYVSVREAIGWVTLLSWTFRALGAGKLGIRFKRPEKIIVLFFILTLTSLFVNPALGHDYSHYMASFIAVMFFYLLTVMIMDSYKKIDLILKMFVLSGAISCVYGLFSSFSEPMRRMYALSKDPNYLAFTLTLPIPYLMLKTIYNKNYIKRVLYLLLILLLASGIILAASRSLLIIAPISLILFSFIERKKTKLLIIFSLLFIGGALLYKSLPTSVFIKRVSTLKQVGEIPEAEDPSITARYSFLKFGLKVIAEYPIIGVGAGSGVIYDPSTGWGVNLHNTYLQLAAESGIPALCIYLLLFISAMLRQWQLRKVAIREGNETLYLLSSSLFLGFIVVLGFNLFFSNILGKSCFLWLGMSVALDRLEESRKLGTRK